MLCGVPLMAHAPWSSGSRSSPCKRVDQKQWVKDQLLGLASEKPDLNLFPELFRGCAALIVLKTAEPSQGLGLVAETVVSRRQEGPVLSIAQAAMDRHIRALESRLGRTGTRRIHWVRGPVLGL